MKNKSPISLYIILPIILIFITIIFFANLSEKKLDTSSNILGKEESVGSTEVVSETIIQNTTEPTTTKPQNTTIQLSFVGDCLCATNENTYYENCFNDVAKVKDPSYFLEKVSKYFLNDDFTIADCENVFSDSNNLQVSDKGQYKDPNIEAYWFKSAAKNANILSVGGIDMVSISNNHINDYGSKGHEDTRNALDLAGVKWGEEGKIVYFKKAGFKIGIICVSMYGEYAVSSIQKALKKAEKKSDYQIIYFHGGTEAIHEPEQWKINACHTLINSGADLIIGDHPHVLQPLEVYKNKTIIYSMGNFIFGGNRHPENRTIIYQHTITLNDNNEISKENGKIIPCYVYTGDTNNWQPAPIKNKAARKKVLDFMNGKRNSPL